MLNVSVLKFHFKQVQKSLKTYSKHVKLSEFISHLVEEMSSKITENNEHVYL